MLSVENGAFSESNNSVTLDTGKLNIVFGDLSTSDQSKYKSEFKDVFDKLKEINVDTNGQISSTDITQIKSAISSSVPDPDIQTACANAFKKTYERAFKYEPKQEHKDSNNNNKLKTGQSDKPKIIEALKSHGLSDAEAEAYFQGYNAKASSTDRKKSGSQTAASVSAAKVAAAEKGAKGAPGDIPVSPSANKNAGYAMTFGIFWNNLFSVYFLYLMDAHLSNFFMYTGLDVYPSYR
ncbi:uncharacterized protein BdWA1_003490 [Babesia duncani]|uniref:Uncharacterized protein n=1 Tax=Babesia duncani TaxID=323732 RepID=A0AAD9UMT2_9APIC|nr:hypothetical protein BdWA1_003490 [Babesia duncani]